LKSKLPRIEDVKNRFVLFALTLLLYTAFATVANAGKLLVHGRAVIGAEPDKAVLNVGVTNWAKEPEKALADNTNSMKALVAALRDLEIEQQDMQTSQYRFSTEVENYRNQSDGEVGFRISNSLSVTVRDFKKLPLVIATAVKTGGNDVSDLSFLVSEPKALIDRARGMAFDDARKEAELSAKAAGLELGEISSITNGRAIRPQREFNEMADAPAMNPSDPDLLPVTLQGQVVVGYEVDVEYEFSTPN
jgi:uncharacterized protein